MAITENDFQNMELGYNRAIRTSESEQYILFSSDPDAGADLHEEASSASRVGHLIIQYASSSLSRPYVSGTLILEAEWNQRATTALIEKLDHEIVSSIGAGSKYQRETFDVEVFIGESVGGTHDLVEEDEEQGLRGLHNQMRRTQEMVDTLPEELSDAVDEIVTEQYDDIEDIIESQSLDEGEKKRRVKDKLRVGLERGLPTIMYENNSER